MPVYKTMFKCASVSSHLDLLRRNPKQHFLLTTRNNNKNVTKQQNSTLILSTMDLLPSNAISSATATSNGSNINPAPAAAVSNNVAQARANPTCQFCSAVGASECALEIWGDALHSILEDIEEEIQDDTGPPIPNNTIRKEIYKRLARERGWFGKRFEFEACIAGDIRDAYPRRQGEAPYMGHRWD